MLSKGKGKIAALIVAKLREKRDVSSDSDQHDKEESDCDAGLESAADDILKAMKSGDAASLASALCSFLELHEGHDCGSDSEEE